MVDKWGLTTGWEKGDTGNEIPDNDMFDPHFSGEDYVRKCVWAPWKVSGTPKESAR